MDKNDMILVSVDDHLCEPPGMFDNHLAAKWKDEAPRIITTPNGDDAWFFNGMTIPNIGLNAVAGRPKEEFGIEPTAFDEMRPGCYDIHERIKDMDAAGVLGSMCFPSFPGFAGRLFATHPNKEFAADLIRAYNDWHIQEWCNAYPGRFIPMALPIIWDAELAAAEVHRVAEQGCFSVAFTENPAKLGYPSFHDPYWDPFLQACVDTGTVLSIHLGSSGELVVTAPDAPMDVMIQLQPMNISQAASDLLWSRVPRTYPDIKIALSEGGTGWVPYFMDRADRTYDMHHLWTKQDFGDLLPSDVFRRNFLTCFIADPIGVKLRHDIGIDNISWEMDYPHSDSTWPNAPEKLYDVLDGVSDSDINHITHENAMRWYNYDPFAHLDKADCTVGALRKKAEGHDITIRPMDKGRYEVRSSSLAEMATRMMEAAQAAAAAEAAST
jgi:predicted TIM-barrel fold metal-dependent hydrolase